MRLSLSSVFASAKWKDLYVLPGACAPSWPTHAVELERQARTVAEREQLLRPLLGEPRLGLVDARVRARQLEKRLHLHALAAEVHVQRSVRAVLAHERVREVVPTRAQPHAPALGIARDQLVSGEVRDAQRAADNRERRRVLEVRLRAQVAFAHRRPLRRVQAPAAHQTTAVVEPLDRVVDPVVPAGHVVQRQIRAQRRRALRRAFARDRRHVARLAGERPRRAVDVVARRSRGQRGVVGAFDRAGAQIRGQARIIEHAHRRQGRGAMLTERALDDAVLVREVVEGRLLLHRRPWNSAVGSRRERLLRAVVVREIARHRVRHVVAGSAEIRAAMEARAEEGVRRVDAARVGPDALVARPDDVHAAAEVGRGRILLVVREERRCLHAEVLRAIRVGHAVAHVARDAVEVRSGERGAVGGRRTAGEPAERRVAAQAQIARAGEVLIGDRGGGPVQRVARRVRHRAAEPLAPRLHGRRVAPVAVVAEVRVLRVRDLPRLRARELNLARNLRARERRGAKEGEDREESELHDHLHFARRRRPARTHAIGASRGTTRPRPRNGIVMAGDAARAAPKAGQPRDKVGSAGRASRSAPRGTPSTARSCVAAASEREGSARLVTLARRNHPR
jgi:hypothetical protein